jgi:molybdopterin-guanine dinucleotide biosynthesis protein A
MIAGIFVGGRGTRLGGVAKGLLLAPDTGEPLATRLARLVRTALPGARVVLVGDATAYGALGLSALPDDPPGIGPLGGLSSLLGEGLRAGSDVLALATDLPHVTTDMVERLATHAPGAAAVAPLLPNHRGGGGLRYHPLFARYSPAPCRPLCAAQLATGRHAIRPIFTALGTAAIALPLSDDEARWLDDWDTPEDIARDGG